jgi:selenocysteine-specific elongation factor
VPQTAFKAVGDAKCASRRFDSFVAPFATADHKTRAMSKAPLTLGTAGHIDHGKTALIEALTGVDTDRLPEERERGISIALGYAPLRTRSGRPLSVIDVPGHERFVRTMVAGSTGIDLFLMVIAADDGVMPQTIEHATVLSALAVRSGVVAVTKRDIADPGGASLEAGELLPGCEIVACSARTGEGIAELRAAIERAAVRLPGRANASDKPVLHIDRSFSVHGQGTVVTGTLWSGELSQGETLCLLPADKTVRVRSLQVHGEERPRAAAGQRVAVNLTGVRARAVGRGDVLSVPGLLHPTTVLDCALELTAGEHNTRVHVHHGTRETPGRLVPLDEDLWQLRLERPILAADRDRLVVRRPSPPDTLGGGVVLDAHARRHGRKAEIVERLRSRRDGRPEAMPPASALVKDAEPMRDVDAPMVAQAELDSVERLLLDAWLRPLTPAQLDASASVLKVLRADGRIVRVSGELYLHAQALATARASTIGLIEREGAITLARLRDELGVSRKSAQALLEHFDGVRVTRRLPDDKRILTTKAATGAER